MDIITDGGGNGREWLSFILQTCDSIFPTGAYAHSFGLEEMVRMGIVSDEKSLLAFLCSHIIPSLIHMDLPLVREARLAALGGDLTDVLEIDRMVGALRMARELREASLCMGRQRLSIMVRVRATPMLESFHNIARMHPSTGHHAAVWGVACICVPDTAALGAYFYQSISQLSGPKAMATASYFPEGLVVIGIIAGDSITLKRVIAAIRTFVYRMIDRRLPVLRKQ